MKKRSHRNWKERSLQQHGLLVPAVSLVGEGAGSSLIAALVTGHVVVQRVMARSEQITTTFIASESGSGSRCIMVSGMPFQSAVVAASNANTVACVMVVVVGVAVVVIGGGGSGSDSSR